MRGEPYPGSPMKKLLIGAAFAALAAGCALADDTAAFAEKCTATAVEVASAGLPPDAPQAQKDMIAKYSASACTCVAEGIAGLGDDGVKVLAVMNAMTAEEMAATNAGNEKQVVVAKLVAGGMSEADAAALYDRVNPQIQKVSADCNAKVTADMQKEMGAGGAAPQ